MSYRIERVNNLIRREISEMLHLHIKDPRLSNFISVNTVSISADMKYAKVFVSCISGSEEKQEILSALAGASGFFRKELTKNLKLRHIPELSFHWDDSIERGDHIMRLIDQVNAEHKE